MRSAAVIGRVRDAFWRTALGPAVLIWGFGYVLVDIVAFLLGRTAPGVNLFSSLPMFLVGVCSTLALDRLRAGLEGHSPWLRWTLLIAGVLAATVLQTLFDVYWIRWLALNVVPPWQAWALNLSLQRLSTIAILYLWTFCLSLTMLWAVRSGGAAEANEARAANAEAAAAKAMAAALRLQLNPHFLFNTMNSISSLVTLDRKDEAEEMIGRLCEFLRASLNADPMEDVPLDQEIDTIDAYLSIESIRFGDRLEIDIHVDPAALPARVPNFILQPLVENAIKHGVALQRGQASLKVAARREESDLVLSVTNTMPQIGDQDAAERRESTGIGLFNVRQRLANRYGERARLETGPSAADYSATIRIPFHEARQGGTET